jgi:hypothetical protein
MSDPAQSKIPLPTFLKALTSNGVPAAKAMGATGKIYKDYNTAEKLASLTDLKLKAAGIDEKDTRKSILAALKKAGYSGKTLGQTGNATAGPSTLTAVEALVCLDFLHGRKSLTTPRLRPRKRRGSGRMT